MLIGASLGDGLSLASAEVPWSTFGGAVVLPEPAGGAVISAWAQIAMASSSNGTATRRFVGSSVASS